MSDDPLTAGGAGQTPIHPDDLEGLRQRWIRTQGDLDRAERQNLLLGTRWANSSPRVVEGVLTDQYLLKLHRRSFGRVWSWAGTYRIRATSIGVDALLIPPAVRDALADAHAQIAADTDGAALRAAVARLHHRLGAIHPFPNGNGRTARLHTELLADALQIARPTWGRGREHARDIYLEALRAADRGDDGPLLAFIWSAS